MTEIHGIGYRNRPSCYRSQVREVPDKMGAFSEKGEGEKICSVVRAVIRTAIFAAEPAKSHQLLPMT